MALVAIASLACFWMNAGVEEIRARSDSKTSVMRITRLMVCAVSAMDVDGSDMNFEDLEDDTDGEDSNNETQLAPRAQVGRQSRTMPQERSHKLYEAFPVSQCTLPTLQKSVSH